MTSCLGYTHAILYCGFLHNIFSQSLPTSLWGVYGEGVLHNNLLHYVHVSTTWRQVTEVGMHLCVIFILLLLFSFFRSIFRGYVLIYLSLIVFYLTQDCMNFNNITNMLVSVLTGAGQWLKIYIRFCVKGFLFLLLKKFKVNNGLFVYFHTYCFKVSLRKLSWHGVLFISTKQTLQDKD